METNLSRFFDGLTHYSDQVLVGLIAGAVGGGLAEFTRYVKGWYQAGRFRGADFHIAATMYWPQPSFPLSDGVCNPVNTINSKLTARPTSEFLPAMHDQRRWDANRDNR